MGELVDVDARSLAEVERFLAGATGRRVALGRVRLAAGPAGAAVARAARASGMTLGATVFLCEEAGARVRARLGPDGRLAAGGALAALGPLLVHECAHVAQFAAEGKGRFLAKYLFFYFTNLVGQASVSASSRCAAYEAIPFECEAFELEQRWAAHDAQAPSDLRLDEGLPALPVLQSDKD